MSIEEYKALMLFHLLTCDIDLSVYSHAAVDEDGDLNVYMSKPNVTDFDSFWWHEIQEKYVCAMNTPPEDFKETLIEL